jgi:hypothetical protein
VDLELSDVDVAGGPSDRFAALRKHDQIQILATLVRGGVAEILGHSSSFSVPVTATFDELGLDGYLRRIGVSHRPGPTLDSLRLVHRAHATAIGFDNVDGLLGRPLSLELGDIQRKVLRTPGGARPAPSTTCCWPRRWNDSVRGDETGRASSDRAAGSAAADPHDAARRGGRRTVARRCRPRRRGSHRTGGDRRGRAGAPAAVAMAGDGVRRRRACAAAGIPIAKMLVVHRVSPDERHVVTEARYIRTTADGTRTSRLLGFDELAEVLADVFGIALTEPELTTIWRLQAIAPRGEPTKGPR